MKFLFLLIIFFSFKTFCLEDQRKVISEKGDQEYLFKAYKKRRNPEAFSLGAGLGFWPLYSYSPSYILAEYSTIFNNFIHHLSLSFIYKKQKEKYDYGVYSGLDLSFHRGFYKNTTDGFFPTAFYEGKKVSEVSKANLSAVFFRLAAYLSYRFSFVNVYFSPGIYSSFYHESLSLEDGASQISLNGITTASVYASFGLDFPLRFADIKKSLNNYFEYGIKDIFFYLELGLFAKSIYFRDPSFSSFNLTAGFKFDF